MALEPAVYLGPTASPGQEFHHPSNGRGHSSKEQGAGTQRCRTKSLDKPRGLRAGLAPPSQNGGSHSRGLREYTLPTQKLRTVAAQRWNLVFLFPMSHAVSC